jgi:hypothetical protein
LLKFHLNPKFVNFFFYFCKANRNKINLKSLSRGKIPGHQPLTKAQLKKAPELN